MAFWRTIITEVVFSVVGIFSRNFHLVSSDCFHQRIYQHCSFLSNRIQYFLSNNFKKKKYTAIFSPLLNCRSAVLCVFTNISNNSTCASKLDFAILLFFQLFDSLLLQQFVLVTYFLPHHLWVDKVKRSANSTVVVGNLQNTCQKVLLVTCTSCNVPFAAVSPTLQFDYLLLHFIVPPTLFDCHFIAPPTLFHCFTNAEFLLLLLTLFHCSTPIYVLHFFQVSSNDSIFVLQFCFHQRSSVCVLLQPKLPLLEPVVCLRDSRISSSSHQNLGNDRFLVRY